MMQILMQKKVRYVINLTEQAQGTNLPSAPQTTKFNLAQPVMEFNFLAAGPLKSYRNILILITQFLQNLSIHTDL